MPISVLFTLTSLSQLQGYVFLTQYLQYMVNKLSFIEKPSRTYTVLRSPWPRRVFLAIIIVDIGLHNLLWISAAFIQNRNIKLVCLRTITGIQCVRTAYQNIFVHISLSELIGDMKVYVFLSSASFNSGKNNSEYVRLKLEKTKKMRKTFGINGFLEFALWMFVTFSDFGYVLYKHKYSTYDWLIVTI